MPALTFAQKLIMWVGIGLSVGCILYPPWLYVDSRGTLASTHWEFLLDAPVRHVIDFRVLALEVFAVLLVSGGILVTMKSDRKPDS